MLRLVALVTVLLPFVLAETPVDVRHALADLKNAAAGYQQTANTLHTIPGPNAISDAPVMPVIETQKSKSHNDDPDSLDEALREDLADRTKHEKLDMNLHPGHDEKSKVPASTSQPGDDAFGLDEALREDLADRTKTQSKASLDGHLRKFRSLKKLGQIAKAANYITNPLTHPAWIGGKTDMQKSVKKQSLAGEATRQQRSMPEDLSQPEGVQLNLDDEAALDLEHWVHVNSKK